MFRNISKVFAIGILLFSMAGITPVMADTTNTASPSDFSMTVFHTNDQHAHLANFPVKSALLKKLRGEKPVNLLLDAGDVFSGTLYFNEFEGQADIAAMNYLKYDAMTFGNHEFDLGGSPDGHKSLAEFVKAAQFPIVSANTDFSADSLFDGLQSHTFPEKPENGKIYNGIIKEVNGEKVGIFGLTTEETVDISSPDKVTFSNYIEEAKKAVASFEKAGVNKIIAITHIGYNDSDLIDNDILLAKGVPGIDIIVGGHTHVKLEKPHVINEDTVPVIIVQANEYNKFLGQLDVTFNKAGVITSHEGILYEVSVDGAEEDPGALEILKPFADKVKETEEKETGANAGVFLSGLRDLGGVRAGETNLGNVITDGMLAKAREINPKTILAFQNGGGIRTSIPKGSISYGDAIKVLPFGNTLALMELSGQEIKAVFEHSVKDYPKESGGFLHISGMKLVFNGEAKSGDRVISMTVDGNELEMDKMYSITTNVFTAKGGDGYDMLKKAYEEGRGSEPGFSDWENFVNHMITLGTVNAGVEARVLATVPFKDTFVKDWSYSFISDLYYRDLLKGTTATTFSPHQEITRAQAVSLLVRTLELTAKNESPFTDVAGYSAEIQAEIAAAYENGLVKKSDGMFNPSKPITRAQFAVMIDRAFEVYTGNKVSPVQTATFTDIEKIDAETKNAISLLSELGIVSGSNGKYMPAKSTTREQAAKIISNFIYNIKQMKKDE
ncbi:5'-nucleotidase C-terminal domain-containing protein [Sporosarcina sp. FA9]|uniref:5'-nucleotidase C-terminal domain-containing protein n=1 Tax=Sporosarcina sp. FA9 TaxID=3413030 RepID=UPI003F658F27